ncbi:MAG: CAP domain-containing protein [Spirochaetaceae bacterium]|nr:CAP domain-containing protein [Spirochaetaceae bacterium]
MKQRNQLKATFFCLGIISILLTVSIACDFQPSTLLSGERPVGGKLALGRPNLEEYIESGSSSGGVGLNTIKSGDLSLPLLTKEEIKKMLDDTDANKLPSDPTQWYTRLPEYTAPYDAGELKQEHLDLTLKRLNALRKLSGLPAVVEDKDATKKAQAGAALMVITQNFGHGSQPVPAGIDKENQFYKDGIEGTNRGNVYPQYPLIQSIDGYNLDPGNPGVGHRLWQLSPGLQAVGIGSAIKKKDANGKEIGYGGNVEVVTYTQAPEGAVTPIGDWNFVSWPSAGYFPLEGNLFGSPSFWHVQFNGAKYTVGSGKIIVTRLDSGEQWIEEHTGGNTLVFNKSNTWRAQLGKYTYEVTGVRDKTTNLPARFVFTTEFFDRHAL